MKKSKVKTSITPPENLYRIEVSTDWHYGKRAKFWEIQKFNQEASDRYGEVVYYRACKGGLSYTNFGMWWAIRRKLKKMKVGNSTKYYGLDKSLL
jgi:hypothetical protein